MPSTVDGVRIDLTQTDLSLGMQVTVRTRRLQGRDLFSMLYDSEAQDLALEMGLVALKALANADVNSAPFSLFTHAYDHVRRLKIMAMQVINPVRLSHAEKRRLRCLLAGYVTDGDRNALVHGDLHASHLIVNRSEGSLGLIDLEAMRIGKAVTNFAQLWEGYYHADPSLAKRLYERYLADNMGSSDLGFDADARAEIALRCHSHILAGKRSGQQEMVSAARQLLRRVLSGESFKEICLGVELDDNAKSLQ